jgi:hypothetical protein
LIGKTEEFLGYYAGPELIIAVYVDDVLIIGKSREVVIGMYKSSPWMAAYTASPTPQAFSGTLDIPAPMPTSPVLPFVSFAAARKIRPGLTVLGCSIRARGVRSGRFSYVVLRVVAAVSDVWMCFSHDAAEGKIVELVVMGVVVGS